jgi:polyhydroxyalkanoate synthesis regulator phasin
MEEHDHSEHHKDEMIKNAIALESHLQGNHCVECESKHGYAIEGALQEQASTNPNANRDELLALADRVREIRRRIQELNNQKHTIDQRKLQSTV